MEASGGGWDEARHAWRRLVKRLPSPKPDDALDALSDIGTVRRLLDRAEMASVRTARRSGRSWAEIATNLGVTRQSAWERWKDLEAEEAPTATDSVVVPDVVGMTVEVAVRMLRDSQLSPVLHNPGGKAIPLLPGTVGVVVDQVPAGRTKRRSGSLVTLWIERDGGSAGVREPRRRGPTPRAAVAEPEHESDRA